MQELIALSQPRVSGQRLEVAVTASRGVRRYLRETVFWCEYPSGTPLTEVPEAILAIPAVGMVAPLAWALGAELRLPRLDACYVGSLNSVLETFGRYYPQLQNSRDFLRTEAVPHIPLKEGGRSDGLLFSGGVDSTASLIALQQQVSDLFSIWGADVVPRNHDFWLSQMEPLLRKTEQETGKTISVIKSNLRHFLDQARLGHKYRNVLTAASWWAGLQHGPALLSVVAPLAYALGTSRVHIASSYSASFSKPWGSTPEIDEQVRWSGTTVAHDGFQRTRQAKLDELVAPYVHAGKEVRLSVCVFSLREGTKLNCGRCEKCVRTQTGLLLAGLDPGGMGFEIPESFGQEVVAAFTRRSFQFGDDEVFMWSDMRAHLACRVMHLENRYGSRVLFAWLETFDPQRYAADTGSKARSAPRAALELAQRSVYRKLPLSVQRQLFNRFRRP